MSTHPQFGDAYELLALTGPDGAEGAGAMILEHLVQGCEECRLGMDRAHRAVAVLGQWAAPVPPPERIEAALRQRLAAADPRTAAPVSGAAPGRRKRTWGRPFAAALAAAMALAIIGGGLWWRLRLDARRMVRLAQERAVAAAQARQGAAAAARLRAVLALLAAPGTRAVPVRLGPARLRAHAFLNPHRGVVLVGERMPALPRAKTYELWLLPARGAPRPAGLFRPDATGTAMHLYQGGMAGVAGIAVSIEPARGSAVPTGPIVLAIRFASG
jgi:anti-sigma-K factor RskA